MLLPEMPVLAPPVEPIKPEISPEGIVTVPGVPYINVPIQIGTEILNPDNTGALYPLRKALQLAYPPRSPVFAQGKYNDPTVAGFDALAFMGVITYDRYPTYIDYVNDTFDYDPNLKASDHVYDASEIGELLAIYTFLTAVEKAPYFNAAYRDVSQHLNYQEWLDYLSTAYGMLPNNFYYTVKYVRRFLELLGLSQTRGWSREQYLNTVNAYIFKSPDVSFWHKLHTAVIIGIALAIVAVAVAIAIIFPETIPYFTSLGGAIWAGIKSAGAKAYQSIVNTGSEVVSNLTDADTYVTLITQLFKDNLNGLLEPMRQAVHKDIQAFGDKIGLDLTAIDDLWREQSGMVIRGVTDTIANMGGDIVKSIANMHTAADIALSQPESNEHKVMLAMNAEIGAGFGRALYDMLFEKVV